MLRGSIHTLTITAIVAATVKAGQLVGFDNKPAALGSKVFGVAHADAEAGEAVTITAIGVEDLIAGAPIAAGDELISDATGKPIPKGAATSPAFGVALNAVSAPGGRVAVLIR